MFKTGTYKVVEDSVLAIYDLLWEQTYADEYRKASEDAKKAPTQTPHRMPLGFKIKSGQKIHLEISQPRPLIKESDEKSMMINALTATVVVLDENTMYNGMMLSYNSGLPSVVVNFNALRLITNQ